MLQLLLPFALPKRNSELCQECEIEISVGKREGTFSFNLIGSEKYRNNLTFSRSPFLGFDVKTQTWTGSVCTQVLYFIQELLKAPGKVCLGEGVQTRLEYLKQRDSLLSRAVEIRCRYVKSQTLLEKHRLNLKYKTKPYLHQEVAVSVSVGQSGIALLLEMGLGKTKIVIDRVCAELSLLDTRQWYKVIVVCPRSLLDNWVKELEKHCWMPFNYAVIRGSLTERLDSVVNTLVPDSVKLLNSGKTPKLASFILVNYEMVGKTSQILEALKPDLLVCDEPCFIKNPRAKRTKAVLKLRKYCSAGTILNGSIIGHSPLDLWSQFEAVEPGSLGFTTYGGFVNRYSSKIDQWRRDTANIPELQESVGKISFIVNKKDCLDLPEKVFIDRPIELAEEQKSAYESLRKTLELEIQSYISSATRAGTSQQLIVTHVLVQLLRLAQITSGFIQDHSMDLIHRYEPNAKLEELISLIDQTNGKVVVWCRFIENINRISKLQQSNGINVLTLSGQVNPNLRQGIVDRFNEDEDVKVLVANPQVGGFGLNILGTNKNPVSTVVYFSLDWNYTWYLQSQDRSHRISMKTNSLTYYNYICPGSIDEVILENLKSKNKIAKLFKDPKEMLRNFLKMS